jgi:bifunctional non-homologous end joining protein LigD
LNTTQPAKIQFIEPMYALAVQNIPIGDGWLYEVKFDGYRCLAGRGKRGVTLWSRRGNLFTAQFPQIARACERLPAGTLLDGEVVAVDQNVRISFNLLQHHRSQAQALLFYAFDVLICRGKSLLNVPLEERRKVLGGVFEKFRGKSGAIRLSETMDGTPADLVRVVENSASKESSPSGRTHSTNRANAAAPGANIGSTKARSSSSAATFPITARLDHRRLL